ncbi:hypothetical protein DPMN_069877 [Dreissena polymorpha]|uniref:Uncharacterized protein n=1 Tax=Dreissena polymorpha TaxID=45954 RepID=A0A9D3Z0C5_DREPO|nr:hypothetical protein DPMN_069877 [Dreissena polymorpha]
MVALFDAGCPCCVGWALEDMGVCLPRRQLLGLGLRRRKIVRGCLWRLFTPWLRTSLSRAFHRLLCLEAR